jgi:flagellar protein FlgJ
MRPIDAPSHPPGAAITPRMRQAAHAFETQALTQLLAPAFATVDMGRSAFGGGAAEAQWRPMLLDALVTAAVRGGGGIGLADAVLRATAAGAAGGAEGATSSAQLRQGIRR